MDCAIYRRGPFGDVQVLVKPKQAPPNRRFADKEAPLAAVAVRGFDQLGQRQLAAAQGSSPRDALVAQGVTYLGFALDQPAMFQLFFVASAKAPLSATAKSRRKGLCRARGAGGGSTGGEDEANDACRGELGPGARAGVALSGRRNVDTHQSPVGRSDARHHKGFSFTRYRRRVKQKALTYCAPSSWP